MGTVPAATNPASEGVNPLRPNESRYLRQGVPKSVPIQMGTERGTVNVTAPDKLRGNRCSATTFEWVAEGSNPEPTDYRLVRAFSGHEGRCCAPTISVSLRPTQNRREPRGKGYGKGYATDVRCVARCLTPPS